MPSIRVSRSTRRNPARKAAAPYHIPLPKAPENVETVTVVEKSYKPCETLTRVSLKDDTKKITKKRKISKKIKLKRKQDIWIKDILQKKAEIKNKKNKTKHTLQLSQINEALDDILNEPPSETRRKKCEGRRRKEFRNVSKQTKTMNSIQSHPAFVGNPLGAIREHLANTIK